MILLVVAVADRCLVLAADQLYVGIETATPTSSGQRQHSVTRVRSDERKVFRGPHVLTGMAGTADTQAGSVMTVLAEVAAQATGPAHAWALLNTLTGPFLPAAIAEWRAAVGSEMPIGRFATVVLAGIMPGVGGVPGTPVALVLGCDSDVATSWHPLADGHITVDGGYTHVAAFGAVPDEAGRGCSGWEAHVADLDLEDRLKGRSPVSRPQATPPPRADAPPEDVLAHIYSLVASGVSAQGTLPRPERWPRGVPLLGSSLSTPANSTLASPPLTTSSGYRSTQP